MPETDPISLFQSWFEEARLNEKSDPTAMALATSDPGGAPSVRMVLLKAVDQRGFVFYTNLESPKALDISTNPKVALCFHWPVLEKQVRVEGLVEPVSGEEADAYFASRPRLSQLGAWGSRQSKPIAGRFVLEQAVAAVALRFPFGQVPRPPYWSGFRVLPQRVEFWHQRPFRHHDRQHYLWKGDSWCHEWLFP